MPKSGRGFVGGNYSDKPPTRIHQSVAFTLQIAPIGGMIIGVKFTLQLQQRILCKWKKIGIVVESVPKSQPHLLE